MSRIAGETGTQGMVATGSLRLVSHPPRAAAPFAGDDAVLVREALAGDERARRAMYDRHARYIHRVLHRILGFCPDLDDLHHEVFIRALRSLHKIEDPAALRPWMTQIAVHVARRWIERKRRRRWLFFVPSDEVPEVEALAPTDAVRDALRAAYTVLGALPPDEQVAFALRYVDGMELAEVAAACGASLATVKRRLARAAERFERGARRQPALSRWLKGGGRWSDPSET